VRAKTLFKKGVQDGHDLEAFLASLVSSIETSHRRMKTLARDHHVRKH
jgi:hypothetical protein